MRKLTAMQSNVYTTKLFDIIVPDLDDTANKDAPPTIMLVMDYVDSDLTQIMKNAGELDLQEGHVVTIMYNILCSVNFLHSCNIMHRDLKPANILIDSKCVPVICDFGLARTCLRQGKSSEFDKSLKTTQSGRKSIAERLEASREKRSQAKRQLSNHVVSRWYRSPELILLEKQYDQAVDMWSVGCILAELLSCLQNKVQKKRSSQILFRGQSCYPLSPGAEMGSSNSN